MNHNLRRHAREKVQENEAHLDEDDLPVLVDDRDHQFEGEDRQVPEDDRPCVDEAQDVADQDQLPESEEVLLQ